MLPVASKGADEETLAASWFAILHTRIGAARVFNLKEIAMFKIEHDVRLPSPTGGTGRPLTYPWVDMEVGDSIKIDAESGYKRAASAAQAYGKRHDMKFASRKNGDGARIWRMA